MKKGTVAIDDKGDGKGQLGPIQLQIPLPGIVQWVNLDDLRPNPWQPRIHRDDAKFQELVESIEKHQLYHNLLGRFKDGVIEIADGHQRLEAYKVLQIRYNDRYDRIPVEIREIPDQEMADIAIETNEKRQGLNPIDLGGFFVRYMEEFKVTQEELGARFGISQPVVANTIRLLELPAYVKELIISQEISPTHGRELLRIKNAPDTQIACAKDAVKHHLTVQQLQREVTDEARGKMKPLSKESFPQPSFDTKGCKNCEHREMWPSYDDKEKPFCNDPSCWQGKEKSATDKQAEKERKQVAELMAGKDATDFDKLPRGSFERIWNDKLPEACKTCEKLRTGTRTDYKGQPEMITVCLDAACLKKTRMQEGREHNRKLEEVFQKLLEQAKQKIDFSQPFSPAVCRLILRAGTGYDEDKELAKELGITVKGTDIRQALEKRLQELDADTLRRLVVLGVIYKVFNYRYMRDTKEFAQFVKSLDGDNRLEGSNQVESASPGKETKTTITDAEVCEICHGASGCKACCRECKQPCNGGQACGLDDPMEVKLSRWELVREVRERDGSKKVPAKVDPGTAEVKAKAKRSRKVS